MNKDTLYVKRKRPTDMLLLAAIYISATLAVALLLGIILYVFVKGIHTVNWAFLTTVTSARKQTTGIAGNLFKYSVHHRDHSADRNPHWCGKRYLPERICQTRQAGLPH